MLDREPWGGRSMGGARGRPVRGAVVLAATTAYVLTAARYVLGGDNGEFATLSFTGGVAHPPGYPLYVMYLRALSWAPASSPAHNASLSTAVLGVLAVALMQRAAMAWGASAFAAALVSAVYAFAPITWQLATHAEAFALNALIALAILVLAAPRCDIAPTKRLALLGLAAGLGLSNHHSIILLAPVGMFAVVTTLRAATRPIAAAASGALAFLVGLTPYAYLVVQARRADAAWIWGDPRDLASLLHHVLRVDYGTTELGISSHGRAPLAHLAALGKRLFTDYLGMPLSAVVVFAAWVRARARAHPGSRWSGATIALFATFLLAGPVFVAWFNLPPREIGALIAERFYLLPATVLCVLAAPGVDRILPTLGERPKVAALLVSMTAAVGALLAYPSVREHHRPTVELYVRNALRIAPARSIIAGTGDHRFGGFLYARYALGLRTDVVFVNPRLLLGDWYPVRISRTLGFEVVRGKDRVLDGAALTTQLLSTGRPLFFTDWFARGLEIHAPSYPLGPLVRIVPRVTDIPLPDALLAANEAVEGELEIEPNPPRDPHTWSGDLQKDYARPWSVLADAFRRARREGDGKRAEACERRARALAPWLVAPRASDRSLGADLDGERHP
jgi:hypothetical protein